MNYSVNQVIMWHLVICVMVLIQDASSKFYLIETDKTLVKNSETGTVAPLFGDYSAADEDAPRQCGPSMGGLGSRNYKSAEWLSGVLPCTYAVMKVDGNKFVITREEPGTPVKINGFNVTKKDYQRALDGEIVELMNVDGNTTSLVVTDGNVMIDGKSLNVGDTISFVI
ncbi:uncharacterized protein LOC111713019 [Eurytemora carolleeae]|uniref:uncharacterized protein LOC111713019 n=1 Tax=Eurytemora carolleeae TaxID=1294199 RepID=UPI000C7814EF|nr:uncharacterized protein LOC111713019 [Eurytemora carolleeae]|eukprot:XP_023343573.1 uncharacterized protein LOC111713019 [Eurytemora affinis]